MSNEEMIAYCKQRIAKGDAPQFHKAVLERIVKDKHPGVATGEDDSFPGDVYQTCVDRYRIFWETGGVPIIFGGREGKAMKEIIMKLKRASKEKSNTGIVSSWDFILTHWERTGDYFRTKRTLPLINQHLQEILDKIRNGATKRDSRKTEAEQLAMQLEERRQQRTQQAGQDDPREGGPKPGTAAPDCR